MRLARTWHLPVASRRVSVLHMLVCVLEVTTCCFALARPHSQVETAACPSPEPHSSRQARQLTHSTLTQVQLPAYNWCKSYLKRLTPETTWAYNPFLVIAGRPDSFWTYLVSSTFSGLCVCAVMQPADTALSRVYNQPTKLDGECCELELTR